MNLGVRLAELLAFLGSPILVLGISRRVPTCHSALFPKNDWGNLKAKVLGKLGDSFFDRLNPNHWHRPCCKWRSQVST